MQSSLEQWSLTPVMSYRAIQDLLLLLEEFKESSFKSFSKPRAPVYLALNQFFTRYGIRKQLQGTIVRQIQKGIVHRNKEMVYENESLKSELRVLIGFGETSVAHQARILNTATTELGFALAGCTIMNMVINGVKEGGSQEFLDSSDEEEEEEVYFHRISIALETLDLADTDKISGHLCKTVGSGCMERSGRRGESGLERNLRNARVSFLTEEEQKERGSDESRDATPDVLLLDEPIMVHGKRVSWIDSKTGFIIPGVSSAGEIQSYRKQAKKYIRLFGPGAFFWPKSGFCEGFLDDVDGLINITPSSSSF